MQGNEGQQKNEVAHSPSEKVDPDVEIIAYTGSENPTPGQRAGDVITKENEGSKKEGNGLPSTLSRADDVEKNEGKEAHQEYLEDLLPNTSEAAQKLAADVRNTLNNVKTQSGIDDKLDDTPDLAIRLLSRFVSRVKSDIRHWVLDLIGQSSGDPTKQKAAEICKQFKSAVPEAYEREHGASTSKHKSERREQAKHKLHQEEHATAHTETRCDSSLSKQSRALSHGRRQQEESQSPAQANAANSKQNSTPDKISQGEKRKIEDNEEVDFFAMVDTNELKQKKAQKDEALRLKQKKKSEYDELEQSLEQKLSELGEAEKEFKTYAHEYFERKKRYRQALQAAGEESDRLERQILRKKNSLEWIHTKNKWLEDPDQLDEIAINKEQPLDEVKEHAKRYHEQIEELQQRLKS